MKSITLPTIDMNTRKLKKKIQEILDFMQTEKIKEDY